MYSIVEMNKKYRVFLQNQVLGKIIEVRRPIPAVHGMFNMHANDLCLAVKTFLEMECGLHVDSSSYSDKRTATHDLSFSVEREENGRKVIVGCLVKITNVYHNHSEFCLGYFSFIS